MEQTLKANTIIAHCTIIEVLGIGGFGITYKAKDEKLDRLVAIKEFLPAELGLRDGHTEKIHARTGSEKNYYYGLDKFLEEAKVLAQFNHPNIVRVHTFEQANNTAYLIMSYAQGEDLEMYLKRINFKGNMAESELKSYMLPVLKGLQAVHEKGLLHRDIKPGNIYLRQNDEPMLIDFGAARYALGEQSKSMSAIISMGYAPPEQYSSRAKQTPATDLYAWAATCYKLITGKAPIESPERSNAFFEGEEDPLQPLAITHKGLYSEKLLTIIDQCLQIPRKNRPLSAQDVLLAIQGVSQQTQSTKTRRVEDHERFDRIANVTPKIEKKQKPKRIKKQTTKSKITPKKIISAIIILAVLIMSADKYYQHIKQKELEDQKILTQWLKARDARQKQDIIDSFEKGNQWFAKGNHLKAFPFYEKAAKSNHIKAQFNLAWLHLNGKGIKKDAEQALYWYKKAAEKGDVNSQLNLAWMYQSSKLIEKDFSQALYWYEKAVEQNNASAQLSLANMYLEGKGVTINKVKAIQLLNDAAKQNFSKAQFKLAQIYQKRGDSFSLKSAAEMYQKAANNKHSPSQYHLAFMYREGQGVEKNDAKALELFMQSAKQAYAPAMTNVGFMYDQGYGVTKNSEQAIKWYKLAAKKGEEFARSALKEKGISADD